MRVVLHTTPCVLIRRGKLGPRDTDVQREDARWGWRQTPERRVHKPRKLRIAGSQQQLEEAREDSSLELSDGAQPCLHLDLGLLASRTARGYIFALWSHPGQDHMLPAALGTQQGPHIASASVPWTASLHELCLHYLELCLAPGRCWVSKWL